MKFPIPHSLLLTLCAGFAFQGVSAQNEAPEKPHIDAILERPNPPTPAQVTAIDITGPTPSVPDGQVDVRDLVIFLSGLPISATFGTAETLAFHSAGSVTLPIFFTKQVPSATTIKFDLGGNAIAPGTTGALRDYTLNYLPNVPAGATSHELTINFEPWNGFGGEKVIRLTINRDPAVIPQNGTFSTHIVRVRQFDAGEFVGSLSFEGTSALSATAVRVGVNTNGTAVIAFQPKSALLGEHITASWSPGFGNFPALSQQIAVSIPGAALGRAQPVSANLSFARLGTPYSEENAAYLEGFDLGNKPALYAATLSIHNLFAAGAATANAFTINQSGRLALQPVQFSDTDTP